jgi:ribokinase
MARVIIAGSINMDVVVQTVNHPKVGETVEAKALNFVPGGKGSNEAIAASRLGAETFLIGKLGLDNFGDELEGFLKKEKLDLKYLTRTSKAKSGTAVVTLSQDNNTVVIYPGVNFLLNSEDISKVEIKKDDILASQFEIPEETIQAFFEKGKKVGAKTILNPSPAKKIKQSLIKLTDILVINEIELAFLLNLKEIKDLSSKNITSLVEKLKYNKSQTIVVTLGKKGVVAITQNDVISILGEKVKVVDTTGAGDCFLGALACQLSRSENLAEALRFANIAASLKVQRLGASSMPFKEEVSRLGV